MGWRNSSYGRFQRGLIDIPLEGYSFTWAYKSASKMSKLDRNRHLTLVPFLSVCFILDSLFSSFVVTTWNAMNIIEPNGLIRMKKKLQLLKSAIKVWSKEARSRTREKKTIIHHKLSEVDKIIDQGMCNDDVISIRTNLLNEIQELNSLDAAEISQKAKIRWSIEGDENTKYFHGILNKKRSQLASHGTLVNGDWISNPDVEDLEHNVTYEKVKRAVWDCGTNKSPGPDGFTFESFREFWATIDQDVFQAVLEFFESGLIPRGCNASFISLIPKIQDAKLVKDFCPISLIRSIYKIITKILANKLCLVLPSIISEVDSEKAADSVKWVYLLDTLQAFGFGQKWWNWINGCLQTATGSVLVNGSPSSEFQFFKGLKQGDLSPFLFILIMETLHLSFSRVINANRHSTFVYGGLGVSSFYASNRALLFKWVWRFLTQESSWWSCFIKVVHGNQGALDSCILSSRGSPWLDIIQDLFSLKSKGIDLMQFMRKKISYGESSSFWNDTWLDGRVLKSDYPRLLALELPRGGVEVEEISLLCHRINDVILPNMSDCWIWSLDGSGLFSIKFARRVIDNTLLPKVDVPTRWVKIIPIKVNIHAWRVCLDKIPTRLNLKIRGKDKEDIMKSSRRTISDGTGLRCYCGGERGCSSTKGIQKGHLLTHQSYTDAKEFWNTFGQQILILCHSVGCLSSAYPNNLQISSTQKKPSPADNFQLDSGSSSNRKLA
ncbi:RNA-directed DNA polymerase, eukaryota [Tanacetum coccineum]